VMPVRRLPATMLLGCEVKAVRKKTYTKIAEPHILAALEDCDAVVTAIGD